MPGPMSAERWERLQEILVASWGLPAAGREAYWRDQTGGDEDLLAELRELSAAREAADGWSAPQSEAVPESAATRRIGPYLVERLIGRGGMGAVYLAHRADGEFEQSVALKVIGLPFEIEPFRERFRRERQILAGLSHPNIAHLLDGGTTEDGEIYLAMEYVDGLAIDQYAKGHDLRTRLDLFRQVCAGVQYAHQHLVIHRDIKPSNILVNAEGVPKLLDFGAAKLLAESEVTQTRSGFMTLAYASPEQLRGEAASTLSDVFSLGALLFELATGRQAFSGDLVSRAGDLRAGQLKLPEALPGDLDMVVRKALAFDAAQRYSSVEQLSEDVRRCLAAEPVAAHPPALAYRARKFVRRHAVIVGLASVFVLGLAGATAFSMREARVAQREQKRSEDTTNFLALVFRTPFFDTGSHHDMTVKELLQLAEKRVAPLLGQGDRATASDVDLVLGEGLANQGAHADAQRVFERALARSRQAGDVQRQSVATSWLASMAYEQGDHKQAWTQAMESLQLWKSHPGSFAPEYAVTALTQSGQLLQFIRPADPVNLEYLEAAVRLARRDAGKLSAQLRASAMQALAEGYIAAPGRSDPQYRQAYPLIQEAVALNRSDPSLDAGLIESLRSWGRVNRFLGHFDEDEAAQREVYALIRKHYGPELGETATQQAIWAYSLTGVGKIEEAYSESKEALAASRRHFPVPGSPMLWTSTAVVSCTACLSGRFPECEAMAREALETLGPNPQAGDLRLYEARSYLGLALAGEGRYAEALPLLRETVEFYHARGRKNHVVTALDEAYVKAQAGR